MNKIEQEAMTDMHREAFERWVQTTTGWKACKQRSKPMYLRQNADGSYNDFRVNDRWFAWQAALCYRDEQDQTGVWRCYKEYMSGDGGRVHSEKFAKTKAEMLIFKSQGYDCEKLRDEQEKQA